MRIACSAAVIGAAIIGPVVLVHNIVEKAPSERRERRVENATRAAPPLAVSLWLRNETGTRDLVATNHFCEDDRCIGESWLRSLDERHTGRLTPRSTSKTGPTLFGDVRLPRESHRRFLIQGYSWIWTYGEPPAWLGPRVRLSVGFANSPSEEERQRLLDEGVDWFVVDLRLTDNRRWLPTTPIVYDDGEFVVLRLTDPPTT